MPGSNWGTITLIDDVTNHVGQIQVTVNLVQTDMKFRDLMLYFSFPSDPAVVSITSGDGQVSLIPDGFSLVPYTGLFDVGGTGTKGWHGDNGYTTFLTGWSGPSATTPLTVDMFDSPDALDTAVHLQAVLNLPSGATSIKLGGDFGAGGGGGGEPVPEPASALLLGCGLIAIAWALRHRKAS
ncbi:MAG: PEP-CTERM sorting domain-containing protein [Bryobacteraceae bacterium]